MSQKLLPLPDHVSLAGRLFGIADDFFAYNTGDLWTSLVADAGTSVAASDAAGGVLVLTTGGTDNNEAMVKSTQKVFRFVANKPLYFRARVQYAEANTDDANIFVGLSSAAAANLMVDNGAGPATNHSAVGFCKADGATRWSVHRSIGTSQETIDLTAANSLDKVAKTAGGSSYQELVIEVRPTSSTEMEVAYWIDNVLVYKQTVTYTGAVVMNAVAYAKAGGSNSEVLSVDRLDCFQLR